MLEMKWFTSTKDIIQPKLMRFCKKVSEDRKINFTGQSVAVLDVNLVDKLIKKWETEMTGITPYYAVKALPDNKIIEKMNYFDCASAQEIKQVLSLGKNPNNIIYANTAKRPQDILDAKNLGVKLTTVDGIWEADKINSIYPECGLVLRICASDKGAQFTTFAHKFGSVTSEKSKHIIDKYHKNIRGFSFHVGCGQTNINAWSEAMEIVDELFEYIKKQYPECYNNVEYIDMGGGYSTDDKSLQIIDIRKSINHWKAKYHDKKWIAEPGRFFCADVLTLLCPIISKNLRDKDRQYYVIGNSIHHTFSCIIFDLHKPRDLTEDDFPPNELGDISLCDGTVVGETCDGVDVLYHGLVPYDLDIGTVLVFGGMGAYSNASANHFNGFHPPEIIYYYDDENFH